MNTKLKLAALLTAATALAGCPDGGDMGSGKPKDDGLSGTPAQFAAMRSPCIAQASRLTGVSVGTITVIDEIRTGSGPLLTLNAGGAKYSCRLEADGRVSVFSEFAN